MAETTSPRVESISDPGSDPRSGSPEHPAQKPRAKAATAGKPTTQRVPEIGAPEDTEKHELDEMA